MRSPLVLLNPFISCCLFAVAITALAVDRDRLWVPKKYESKFIDLVKAANVAEALERCVRVVEGTIDLNQGTEDQPLYRILCMQANKRTYNEMVDGLTFEPLTTVNVAPPELSAEEIRRREEIIQRRKEAEIRAKKQQAWQLCYAAARQFTHKMIELVWLNESYIEPLSFSDEKTIFHLDFSAKDVMGAELNYRAICHLMPDQALDLKVIARKDK